MARDWGRGIGILILINGIFLLGLAYDGYMIIPELSPRDPAFNVFAALTFIVQLWHGGGCLAVYGAESLGGPLAWIFVRDPGGAYSDLGSFHFAVAGGLNYFATVRLWDLMRPDHPVQKPEASDGRLNQMRSARDGGGIESGGGGDGGDH